MDPGEESGLLASLRERALQYEEALRTVRAEGKAGGQRRRRRTSLNASTTPHGDPLCVRAQLFTDTHTPHTPSSHPLPQAETARLDAWRAERPEIKAFIAGLAESRAVLRRELARVEASAAGRDAAVAAAAAAVGPSGVTSGFNVIRCGIE